MPRSARPAADSAWAWAVMAVGTLSCQFPDYRVDANGSAAGAAPLGGASAEAGSSVGGASGAVAGMTTGAVAGQSGNFPEPVGMALGETASEAVWRTPGGGEEFRDACPVNQVLIGLQGTVEGSSATVRSVQGTCGEVSIVNSADGSGYEAHISPSILLPERGGPTNTMQVAACPSDQLMTGFAGRSGAVIDAIQIRCAALRIVGAATSFELLVHGENSGGSIGGPGGSSFAVTECSADQVALGHYVRTEGSLSAFGLLCAIPSLIFKTRSGG